MKSNFMDGEFFLIVMAGIFSVAVALKAKIDGDRKQKQYLNSQDSLFSSQHELLEVQKKIIALNEMNNEKANEIINVQMESQAKADEIIRVQNELQNKTEEVSRLNQVISERQMELNENYERVLNPIFPMKLQADFVIPFDSKSISENVLAKIYQFRNTIDDAKANDLDLSISRERGNGEISTIQYKSPNKEIDPILSLSFITQRVIKLILSKTENLRDLEDMSNVVFSGMLSLSRMVGGGGTSIITINYNTKMINVHNIYDQLIVLAPKIYKSIGIRDLSNKYIILNQNIGDRIELKSIFLNGGATSTNFRLNIGITENDKRQEGGEVYYIHKINEKEIVTKNMGNK